MSDLVIVGAGGHGREMLDVARVAGIAVLGFVDDDPAYPDRIDNLGITVLGDLSWLEANPAPYALGIGAGAVRQQMSARFDAAGCTAPTIIHPHVSIGSACTFGDGVAIYDRTVITTNVTIGSHTHINVGCAIQHDTVVGNHTQISPGVFINGDCNIGDDVFIGSGAIITRGCWVGDGARIGAGSVVLSDVPAGVTVVGSPAAPLDAYRPTAPQSARRIGAPIATDAPLEDVDAEHAMMDLREAGAINPIAP